MAKSDFLLIIYSVSWLSLKMYIFLTLEFTIPYFNMSCTNDECMYQILPTMSVRPSVHPSIHPSIRPSFRPSFRPSVRPSIHPSACLSLWQVICNPQNTYYPSLQIHFHIGKIQVTATRWRIRHNTMLLWFVKIYERNLKKLQFTTQRLDIPTCSLPVCPWHSYQSRHCRFQLSFAPSHSDTPGLHLNEKWHLGNNHIPHFPSSRWLSAMRESRFLCNLWNLEGGTLLRCSSLQQTYRRSRRSPLLVVASRRSLVDSPWCLRCSVVRLENCSLHKNCIFEKKRNKTLSVLFIAFALSSEFW